MSEERGKEEFLCALRPQCRRTVASLRHWEVPRAAQGIHGVRSGIKSNHALPLKLQKLFDVLLFLLDSVLSQMATEFSAAEAKLYDRQLRVWGLDAQKRMRNAHVLVASLNAINAEVCKNLALAGIGTLTLIDHRDVSLNDLSANIFIREGDVNQNRAKVCASRVQELNPNVEVSFLTDEITSKDSKFFSQFAAVCVGGLSFEEQADIDSKCRKSSTAFLSSVSMGFLAWSFQDLNDHAYEVIVPGKDGASDTKNKLSKKFPSLQQVLSTKWEAVSAIYRKRLRSSAAVFLALQLAYELASKLGVRKLMNEHMDQLIELRNTKIKQEAVDISHLPDDILRSVALSVGLELCAVCAIMGGLLAQEVLKAISHRDEPLDNIGVFNAADGAAVYKHV